jgi:predicted histone-like DNA-binding protein
MSIRLKTITKKNPRKPEDPAKFYVVAETAEKKDIDDLSATIAQNTTVSRADVYAVVMALLDTALEELKEGNAVYFGKLGSFILSVNSQGVTDKDQVSKALVNKAKIVYRPGAELKKMLKTLTYRKPG